MIKFIIGGSVYTENEKKSKKWLLFIPLIIALIVLIVLLMSEKSSNKPKSNDFEKRIIADAKEYVNVNNVHENTFITLADIESSIGTLYDTCNKSSGVDYRNGKYEPYVICTRYISPKIEQINNQIRGWIIIIVIKILLLKACVQFMARIQSVFQTFARLLN